MCLDPLAVSSEAASAYLMDGEVVAAWASSAFQKAQDAIASALERSASGSGVAAEAAEALDAAAAALAALRHVADALASGAGGASSQAQALRSDLERWSQYAEALSWLARAGPPLPQHEWQSDWAAAVERRRAASAPEPLFLHDLLGGAAAGEPGGNVAPFAYPPRGAASAARAIFTAGGCGEDACRAKAALFCYYLLDAGPPDAAAAPGGGAADAYAAAAGLPAALALEVRAGYLLDAAAGGERPEAAAAAARLLPGGARDGTPLKFVRVLAARGMPDAALALLRAARGGGLAAPSAPEALAAARARLACGLLAEAFCGVAAFAAAEEARGGAWARANAAALLVPELAAAAEASGQLGSLAALPFAAAEERALVAWLRGRAQAGAACAEALPAYYLARGRGAEAVAASALLDAADAARGGAGVGLPPAAASQKRALAEARRADVATRVLPALPPAQRNLALAGAAPPPQPGGLPVQALEAVPASDAPTLAAAAGAPDALRAPWCLRALAAGLNPPPLLLPPHQLRPQAAPPAQQQQPAATPQLLAAPDAGLRAALAAEAADASAFAHATMPLRLAFGRNDDAAMMAHDHAVSADRFGADSASDAALAAALLSPLASMPPAGALGAGTEPPLPPSPFAQGGAWPVDADQAMMPEETPLPAAMPAPWGASPAPWASPAAVSRPAASPAPSMLFAGAGGEAPQPLLSPPMAASTAPRMPSAASLLSPGAGAPMSAFGARRAARAAALAYESGGAPDALLAALGAEPPADDAPAPATRRGPQRTLTPVKRPRRTTAVYAKQ